MFKMLALAALLLAEPAGAFAQPADSRQPQIVVVGNGTASQPPDFGRFTYDIRGEGKTEVDALRALSAARSSVEAGLTKLADATRVDVEPSDLSVSTARAGDCRSDDDGISTGPCAIAGYVASMKATVEIEPAAKVGDAISLAAELGATNASFAAWAVRDQATLRDAAVRDAIARARREAERLAESSGLKLGPILRIEGPNLPNLRDAVGMVTAEDVANFAPRLPTT